MTLRDYFAAKAMQAIISTSRRSKRALGGDYLCTEDINLDGQPVNQHGDRSDFDVALRWIPATAYAFADAMLEARKSE